MASARPPDSGIPSTSNPLKLYEEIKNRLKQVGEKNEIVIKLRQLGDEESFKTIIKECQRIRDEYMNHHKPDSERPKQLAKLHGIDWSVKLEEEYREKLRGYLQEQLCISVDLAQDDLRCQELGEALFYYLLSDENPEENIQTIVRGVWEPFFDDELSWYELCCSVLYEEKAFRQLYIQLGQTPPGLSYMVFKHPGLLLHKKAHLLVHRLAEHLPYNSLHELLGYLRDENGRTHMFFAGSSVKPYAKLYCDHMEDLCQLLSRQDAKHQTALHFNTDFITRIIEHTYKPRWRNSVGDLLSIKDKNEKTACEVIDGFSRKRLLWLTEQVGNNRYIQYDRPIVLISYTTRKRKLAKEEADAIYTAFNSRGDLFTSRLEQDQTEEELMESISDCATRTHIFNGQPHSALIVILMSHGSVGFVDDSEGHPMTVKSIEEVMCKHEVSKGRPKVLIMQCCQSRDESDKNPPYVPTSPHFCAIMSSVSGQRSKRGIFLTKLAEQVENCKKNVNIQKMVGRVCTEMEREEHPQTPIMMGTLKAELCPANSPYPSIPF